MHNIATNTISRKTLISCMVGNALEWYDFAIYGYLAYIIGILFFPASSPTTQLLASWVVFWAGFIARPLGAVIFGHISDKVSRKKSLTISIYLMAIPTSLIGLLPTYDQVGIIATISLIAFRTMQGFAIGGAFTGSMVFLVEHAEPGKKGLWGSWVSCSAVVGVIAGSILIAILNYLLSHESMLVWGWRIPFLLSIAGSLIGVYIRKNLQDSKEYMQERKEEHASKIPIKEIFTKYPQNVLAIVFLDFLTGVGFFIVAVFLATYFQTYLFMQDRIAFMINSVNMCVFAAAILLGGVLLDKFKGLSVLLWPCIGFLLLSLPLFYIFQCCNPFIIFIVHAILALMFGIFFGALPAILTYSMPVSVRCSGISIAHNLSMAIFGGSAPFLASELINITEINTAPAFLLIVAAAFSIFGISRLQKIMLKEKNQLD